MSKETIQRLNDITGQILESQSKIETYIDLTNRLHDEKVKYSAHLVLQIGERRYINKFHLNIEEILPVINRKIKEETELLEKLNDEYEKLR